MTLEEHETLTPEDNELDVPEVEEDDTFDAFEDSSESLPDIVPRESTQLTRVDPFRRYLMEISRLEPLDPDTERELAVRYRREGDQQAAYRLVSANLKLVVKIALLYTRVWANVMDLIQEGNIGLLEAVRRFDPFKGARLPTYASWWIKAYIIKFIIDNFRIVRVGTTNERRKLLFNLRKEKERLRLQGIEPTPQLIAKRLNVTVEDVHEVEKSIESSDLSLEAPIGPDGSIQLKDTLSSGDGFIDDRLARVELSELFNQKIEEFASTLNKREKIILRERLLSDEPRTLQDIAGQFGVTREAIRLNEKSLIRKIKTYMQEALKGVTRVEIGLLE